MSRSRGDSGIRILILIIAALTFPRAAAAQRAQVVRAFAELSAALDGNYGDEGDAIARRLDDVSQMIATWDRSIRETEQNVRTRLDGAGPEVAAGAHETLGTLYLERGRIADAVVEFDAASKLAPPQLSLRVSRALALEVTARPAMASAGFREVWALAPDDPVTTYLAITHQSIADADLVRAREALWRSVQGAIRSGRAQKSPFPMSPLPMTDAGGAVMFPLARYSDGFALAARGLFDDAIASLRKATARDPLIDDPAVHSERMRPGATALRRGSLRDARAAFQKAVDGSPNSSEAHRMLATAAALAGDSRTSAQHFEAARKLRPDDERSWIAFANMQTEGGATVDAIRTLKNAIAAIPTSGRLRWRLSGLLARVDQVGEAQTRYRDPKLPPSAPPFSGRAAVLQAEATWSSLQLDFAEAAEFGERRVRANLNDAAAHRDLAGLYIKGGRQNDAFPELAIAAWLDPGDQLTLLMLGQTLMAERRDEDAVAVLERAVSLQPDLRDARYALAQALTRASRRDEAETQLAEFERQRMAAMAREQRQIDIAAAKADAVKKSAAGQHRQAIELWERVITLEPNVSQNYLGLAEALVTAGRLAESVQYFVKTADLDGVADVHRRLADILGRLGRTSESALARETYEKLRLEDFRRRSAP